MKIVKESLRPKKFIFPFIRYDIGGSYILYFLKGDMSRALYYIDRFTKELICRGDDVIKLDDVDDIDKIESIIYDHYTNVYNTPQEKN